MRKVVLYEGSGGQLWLWPDQYDTAVFVPGHRVPDGTGMHDLMVLSHTDGETPSSWTVERVELPRDAGRPDLVDAPQLVASYDPRHSITIYPDRCGNAARAYLGIPREDELHRT